MYLETHGIDGGKHKVKVGKITKGGIIDKHYKQIQQEDFLLEINDYVIKDNDKFEEITSKVAVGLKSENPVRLEFQRTGISNVSEADIAAAAATAAKVEADAPAEEKAKMVGAKSMNYNDIFKFLLQDKGSCFKFNYNYLETCWN